MPDYTQYERLLTDKVIVTSIMISIVVILILACGVYVIVQSRQKHLSPKFLIPLGVLLLFALGGWFGTYINCKMDKEEHAYITFEGDFSCENQKYIFLKDSHKTRLWTTVSLPDGPLRGKLVYSKRSKILVDYELYDESCAE